MVTSVVQFVLGAVASATRVTCCKAEPRAERSQRRKHASAADM